MTQPMVPHWNGKPEPIVDEARKQLGMKMSDPDIPRLERTVGAVMSLVLNYLGWDSYPALVPDPIREANIFILVEAYRRRDLAFGVLGTTDADGVGYRISGDWIAPQLDQIRPFKISFGIA
jgi:hypothetical protein